MVILLPLFGNPEIHSCIGSVPIRLHYSLTELDRLSGFEREKELELTGSGVRNSRGKGLPVELSALTTSALRTLPQNLEVSPA